MRPCLPPLDIIPQPGWRAPAGSCDCHFHIFGTYDRFPLDPGRHYEPPAALDVAAERTAKDEALLRAFEGSGKTMEEFAEMYGLDPRASARVLERARKRVPSA